MNGHTESTYYTKLGLCIPQYQWIRRTWSTINCKGKNKCDYILDQTFREVHDLLFEHPVIIYTLSRHNVFLACIEWEETLTCSISETIAHFTTFTNSMFRVETVRKLFWVYSYLFPCISLCGESLSSLRCSFSMQQQLSEMIITNSFRASIIVTCRWVIMSSPPQGFGRSTTVTQIDSHNKKYHIRD